MADDDNDVWLKLERVNQRIQGIGKIFAGCGCLVGVGLFVVLVPSLLSSCSLPPPTAQDIENKKKIDAWVMAEGFVKDHIKSPSTASFGGISDYQDPKTHVTALGDNQYHVAGWVDAQNAFGATVRTYFSLKVRDKGGPQESWGLVGPPVFSDVPPRHR